MPRFWILSSTTPDCRSPRSPSASDCRPAPAGGGSSGWKTQASSFEVYCTVKLSLPTKDNLDAFETAITKLAEVVQCATVTGAADYELRIVTRDMHAFDDFLRDKILSLGLVSNIESRIVIRSVKNTTAAPLGLVSPYVSAHS